MGPRWAPPSSPTCLPSPAPGRRPRPLRARPPPAQRRSQGWRRGCRHAVATLWPAPGCWRAAGRDGGAYG
eukprot:1851657-Alexandrium_andersonii.AAC.1